MLWEKSHYTWARIARDANRGPCVAWACFAFFGTRLAASSQARAQLFGLKSMGRVREQAPHPKATGRPCGESKRVTRKGILESNCVAREGIDFERGLHSYTCRPRTPLLPWNDPELPFELDKYIYLQVATGEVGKIS
jgi:hypothetical protein